LLPWRLFTIAYIFFIEAVTPKRSAVSKPAPKKKVDAAANLGVLGRGKGTEKSAIASGTTKSYFPSMVPRGRIFGKA